LSFFFCSFFFFFAFVVYPIVIHSENRLRKIKDAWWSAGTAINEQLRQNLSRSETTWLEEYDKLMGSYTQELDLDLQSDQQPPKALYVEVRALRDFGEISTDTGTITLEKNSVHYLRRSDVELLIRQGVLEEIDTN
jgi:GINS complex subunit 1